MGKRDKPCECPQLVNQDCWPKHALLRHVFHAMLYTVFFFAETDGVFALPLAFPFLSVQFRNTLRVCREISLPVSDDQRELRECVLFPTPPVGWTCTTLQCLAQPFVRCTSAAFQPFLEHPLSQTPHTFRWHLAWSTDTFTFQKREDDRRTLVDNRLTLLWAQVFHHLLAEGVATLNEDNNFLAARNACSGVTGFGVALRIVLTHWPKAFQALNSALPPPSRMTHPSGMDVSPNTSFMRKVANWPDEGGFAHSSDLYPIS